MVAKTRIEYTTHQSLCADGPWTVYLFYPGGTWDEDKFTLEQAEVQYPKSLYDWVDVTPQDDAA